jgi:hypothetical protein
MTRLLAEPSDIIVFSVQTKKGRLHLRLRPR